MAGSDEHGLVFYLPQTSGRQAAMTAIVPLRPLSHPDLTHVVVQVLQEMNYDVSDKDRFLKQAQNVDFGLSAEHEFAAIAAWLGRCRLIHQLGQERLCSLTFHRDMIIPDLLMMIEHRGQMRSVLVEVKTTECIENPEDICLHARPQYLEALRRYADRMGLPLLIAWHPRSLPFWMLFDPAIAPYDESRGGYWFFETVKHDLMDSILGDFTITPLAGAGISIRFGYEGPKEPVPGGYEARMKCTDAYWHDPSGTRLNDAPDSVLAAVFAVGEAHAVEDADGLTQSFVAAEQSTKAQVVLRMLAGWALEEGQRIHWRAVVQNLEHFLPRDKLHDDLQRYFGSCIKYVLHVLPTVWPGFVPEEWKHG